MKKIKRLWISIVSILLLAASISATSLSAFATTTSYQSGIITGDGEITRAEWLHNLVVAFEMFVEDESLPDNYYSDLDESHTYYEDIILAVEFGVVDIHAGYELKPDEPATRDFVASTLNFCLGYQLEENTVYAFNDADECTDADSAQIAIDRGWFALSDGKFNPTANVTSEEVETIFADVEDILARTIVDTEYDSSYVFAADILVVPDGTTVVENTNGTISITDSPVNITAEQKFAVYLNGIPNVYIADSVITTGNITEITVSEVDTSDAFLSVDAQGAVDSEAMTLVPEEGVDVSFEEDDSAISTFAVKKLKTIKAKTSLDAIEVTVKIKNPTIEYSVNSNYAYVILEGDTEISYGIGIKADMTEILSKEESKEKSLKLFTVPVAGIGSFDISVEFDISGSATGKVEGYLTAGLECTNGGNIRTIKNFQQKQCSSNAEGSGSVGIKVRFGVTKLPVIEAYIYAEVGVKAKLKTTPYNDDIEPSNCVHFAAYLYAKYGATASVKIAIWKTSLDYYEDIFSESNSPVKIVHHYEDGIEVAECTRDSDDSTGNYFTPGNSCWGGSGWSGANGAYGLNADGTAYKLYDYTLNGNNQATITKYYGNSWSVYVPSEIDGYTVVAIGKNAFTGKSVSYVNIPDSVTTIGMEAFSYCTSLRNVTLPKTATYIGAAAFRDTAIESILIPKSLTSVGSIGTGNGYDWDYIFEDEKYEMGSLGPSLGPFGFCEQLKNITFEDGTTQILSNLFRGAVGIEKITIPDTVTTIGTSAFQDCFKLSEVKFGNAVTTIGDSAFYRCVSLTSIGIPDSVTSIGTDAFSYCISLKNATLSKTLTHIGAAAFSYSAIENIEIPKSLNSASIDANKRVGLYTFDNITYSFSALLGPFGFCEELKSVTFENGTTKVIANLFMGAVGLEKITIPDTVITIEERSFEACFRLSEVKFGNAVATIGESAFKNCDSLNSIEIPNTITSISKGTFSACDSLNSITIPDSVTSIGADAFSYCTSLKNVTLPKTLTYIGGAAFRDTVIESIEIPKSLTSAGSIGTGSGYGWNYTFEDEKYELDSLGPFGFCEQLKNITFEDGTTKILSNLFRGAVGLEKIIISDTVTTIGTSAFQDCFRLNEVKFGNAVTTIGDSAFYRCISLSSIGIPDSVTSIGTDAFRCCTSLKKVTLSKALTHIGATAFCYSAIENIEIPKSLNSVDIDTGTWRYTFGNREYILDYLGPFGFCEQLKNITFEDGTTKILSNLFRGAAGLEKITIPDTVTTIGTSAFQDCLRLSEVKIGNSVTTIEFKCFWRCVSLNSVEIPDSVYSIGNNVFSNCTSLYSIEISDSVTSLGSKTFSDCSSLSSVEIPDTVTSIGESCFYNCTSLKTIKIPDSINTIPSYAFYGCSGLEEITLSNNTKEIGTYAFQNCVSLKAINIPQSTKTIGVSAFMGCSALSDVQIADYSVTKINAQTFKECPALGKVILPKGLTTIGSQAFMNCTGLSEITIPETVTSIDTTALSYPNKTVICGKTGSYAETFATSNGFTFQNNNIPSEGISLVDGVDYIVMEQGETYLAEFECFPEDANDSIALTANNTNVTISGHDIYARYTGDSVITATASSGVTYEFTVHIRGVKSIEVVTQPAKTSYLLGEEFDASGMVLQVNYDDDTYKTVTNYSVSGFDSSTEGDCTVTVKWIAARGTTHSTTFPIEIVDPSPKMTGIYISTKPTKLQYERKESLDLSGMVVKATYSDNSEKILEATDYTVSGYNALKNGTQTLTVTCGGFATTFDVTVGSVKTLTSISVNTLPNKTTYYIGDTLNTDGLILNLTYSDTSTETITSGYEVSGFSSTTTGTKVITVTYGGQTTTFNVMVNELISDENKPVISVERKSGKAGKTVLVTVSLDKNPGIWGMDLLVNYDKNQLTLSNVTNGTVFGTSEWTQGNLTGQEYILSYEADGMEDITANGVLATLEFTVNASASVGSFSNITLSYDAGDIINTNFDDIDVMIESGGVDVIDFVFGDLNGDMLVNKKDSLLMKMYLANNATEIDMQAADVYYDGNINKKDSLYLKQYLAGLDVELGA